MNPDGASEAKRLADLLLDAGERGTVVFTGAGISTESGIPDFRSPGGLWTRYAPIEYLDYLRDPDMRRESWRRGLHTYPPMAEALPNAAHLAIADWWRAGLVSGVVTQNIDGLHQRAGLPEAAVVELHGNAHRVSCLTCGISFDRPTIHARVLAGDEDPACPGCGGILKTTTISFGQGLPAIAVAAAQRLHAHARLCLVIGSSLVVVPAAILPEMTLDAGGQLCIVNLTPTYLDDRAVLVARHPAAVLCAQVQGLLAV
ncbi:MAG TPA: Sir2 family NAD-dependent protein deacetylase [Chloroflexota bacterium]|nr:Sir2 family NAD-dependent protein deacetylase [Chloroflexota bacterium]